MGKDEVIDLLVKEAVNNIIASHIENDYEYLIEILNSGFKGYEKFSKMALQQEYYEIFGDKIDIQ